MARQTNGTSDFLVSASSLTLSGSSILTVALWLACDSYTNDFLAMSYGDSVNGAFFLKMNEAGAPNFGDFFVYDAGFNPWVNTNFTRPATSVWHHYVFAWDRSLSGTSQLVFDAMDGAALPGGSPAFSGNASSTWGNIALDLMRYPTGNPGDFSAGRIAEVAIYSGYAFNGTDAAALYNSGRGALATSVQTPTYYWRLLGDVSPEPATVGGIDLTVNGATYAIHPFDLEDQELEAGRRFVSVP